MTKEEIDVIKNMANALVSIPAPYVRELIEHYEKELEASRDSRQLSAVPSEEINILKRVVGLAKAYLEMHMNNEHPQKSMLRLDRNLINGAEDFLNKRGIAG